jgi:mannose-6-phosphate isomerase
VERVWGSTDLSPWFPPQDCKIGEVWFQAGDCPLLVKFIFTSEALSVQVHPDDAYAREHHGSCGKTEMWHILDAKPGARIATGLNRPVSRDEFSAALADGTVQQLLNFVDVAPEDTHLVRAGIVHAIGAGVKLCEIQQNCDITYRLYDYGRPRELHLDHGLEVADLGPYESRRKLPVTSEYFRTDSLVIGPRTPYEPSSREWLVIVRGEAFAGDLVLRQGEVWEFDGDQAVTLATNDSASALRVEVVEAATAET